MSSGICQRGEEDEDVHGFLVDDIKKEIRRSSRLVNAHLYVDVFHLTLQKCI